jgi:hypothetical protein
MSDVYPTDPRLENIKKQIAAKPETVVTIEKPLSDDTSTLADGDIEVLTIKVRVPSSALLEDISISRRGANTVHDRDGLHVGDNDPTDGLGRHDVTDTI